MSKAIETVRKKSYVNEGGGTAVRVTIVADAGTKPTLSIDGLMANGYTDRDTDEPKVNIVPVTGA